ncbi:MAG: hypothetical protein IPK04_17000 [Bdellovibrionales bacterium]|nr:hypothetical protein [Bdellovibrionales bacterium]
MSLVSWSIHNQGRLGQSRLQSLCNGVVVVPRVGWIFGDLVGSFRCSSIFWITSGSVIAKMTAILPPQTLQISMSILKTRLSS